MDKYISFSGGVESTTMCILYGKGAKAIWCDTGWEHAEMYDRINECEAALKKIHGGDFEIIRIKPSVTALGEKVDALWKYIKKMKYMPTKLSRYCTDRFKIQPIEKFLKVAGECELMIGFNADETERTGNLEKLKNVKYTYPLIESDFSRDMCVDILNMYGLNPDFPPYMQRGGCVGCIFKSIAEFKALYFFNRSEFDSVRQLEESVQDLRQNFFSISMSQKPMSWVASECERELAMFGDQVYTMYQKVKPSQSCGAFCHR